MPCQQQEKIRNFYSSFNNKGLDKQEGTMEKHEVIR